MSEGEARPAAYVAADDVAVVGDDALLEGLLICSAPEDVGDQLAEDRGLELAAARAVDERLEQLQYERPLPHPQPCVRPERRQHEECEQFLGLCLL